MPFVRLVALAAMLALAVVAMGCGGGENGGNNRTTLEVVATIAPVGALAREVGGDLTRVRVLVGPGVDPHLFSVQADDRKALESANVILRNGVGIDAFLDSVVDPRRAVTVTGGIVLRESGGAPDPHVWQDPMNAMAMVDSIATAFAAKDGANAETYLANAARYKQKLEQTDAQIRALLDSIPAANRKMVTNHDSIGYFIARYNLRYVGAVIPSLTTGAEPSAKDVSRLSDLIRAEGVKAIFAESSVDPKLAEQLARDTGVRIVDDLYGDSLGPAGSGAETVDGMLLANARTIAEALK